jgi:hypothetical protein
MYTNTKLNKFSRDTDKATTSSKTEDDVFGCINTRVRKELQGIYKAYSVVHGTESTSVKAENKN